VKKTVGTKPAGSSRKEHGVKVGDAALKKRTGKTWPQWFQILDKAGAKKLNHTQIATLLYEKLKVPGWWCQMVAVGYEQSRGMREIYQSGDSFSANLGRTFACGVSKLYSAFNDQEIRRAWLKRDRLEVSTANVNKSIRGKWDGASRLEVRFTPKGPVKTQLAIDHMKLASRTDVEKMKVFWTENLELLRKRVEA
jgi:hypothetical protein